MKRRRNAALQYGREGSPSGYFTAVFFSAALLSSSVSTAQGSHREEAKRQLAVRAAAREVLDNLAGLAETNATDSTLLVEELKKLMLKNVQQHRGLKESLGISRQHLKTSREAMAVELVNNATARANDLSPIPVTRKDITARLGPGWPKQKQNVIDGFAANHCERLFNTARSDAVMSQKALIERSVKYPAFEEIDTRLTGEAPAPEKARTPLDRQAFDRLQPWIHSLTFADNETFEENLPVVRNLGKGMLSEIRAQYDRQIAAVSSILKSDKVPPGCITSTTIDDFLVRSLAEAAGSVKPADGAPVYSPFTAVKNHAAWQAAELEKKRLLAFISQPDSVKIERSDIEQHIERELSVHHNPAESRRILVDLYSGQFRRPLAERYAARSKTPAVNQVDLLLLENKAVSKAFRSRIDDAVKEALPPVRASLAGRQFERIFPALKHRTPFSGIMVEFLHDRQAPRIDSVNLLRELLNTEQNHAPQPHSPGELLAETETLAIDAANARAVPLVSALGAQLRILSAMEKDNMEQLRRDTADGKPLDAIRKAWKAELESRWKKESGDLPGPARRIFERTADQLEKTVRQLYSSFEAEKAAEQEPEEIQAQTVDGEKPAGRESESVEVPDEQEEEEPEEDEPDTEDDSAGMEEELLAYRGLADFLLIVADAPDGNCRAVFGRPATGTVAGTDFSPSEIEDAAEEIAGAVEEEFGALLQSKASSPLSSKLLFWRKHTPQVRVLVLERSRQTRHITTILLQRRIKDQLQRWTETGKVRFELDWQESLGLDE